MCLPTTNSSRYHAVGKLSLSKNLAGFVKQPISSSSSSLCVNEQDKPSIETQAKTATMATTMDKAMIVTATTQAENMQCENELQKLPTMVVAAEKHVSFSMHATVRPTIHLNNFSEEEIQASWFTDVEYNYIRQKCSKEVMKMEKKAKKTNHESKKTSSSSSTRAEKGNSCTRGLECYTRLGRATRTENRSLASRIVMDIQDVQMERGYLDEEEIAEAYHEVTANSQIHATAMGYADQCAVVEQYCQGALGAAADDVDSKRIYYNIFAHTSKGPLTEQGLAQKHCEKAACTTWATTSSSHGIRHTWAAMA